MSINSVTVSGNLGQDPKLSSTKSGTSVCELSLCVNNRVKSNGEWVDKPCWLDVVVWGKRGETVAQYLSKGDHVTVNGHLDQTRWEKDGKKYSRIKIICDTIEWPYTSSDGRPVAKPVVDESIYDTSIPF